MGYKINEKSERQYTTKGLLLSRVTERTRVPFGFAQDKFATGDDSSTEAGPIKKMPGQARHANTLLCPSFSIRRVLVDKALLSILCQASRLVSGQAG